MQGENMEEEEVPAFFLCPISLQIMEDPVTLITGVTYDRRNINLWFSSNRRKTCPVTNQPIYNLFLTPNTTLLNLIKSWKQTNSSSSSSSPPSSFSSSSSSSSSKTYEAIDLDALRSIASELRSPDLTAKTLESIAKLVQTNEDYKACMEEKGITELVATVATMSRLTSSSLTLVDEATSLLYSLSPSKPLLKRITELDGGKLVAALSVTIQKGNRRASVHAVLLLERVLRSAEKWVAAQTPAGAIDGVVAILKGRNSDRSTTKAALSVLMQVVATNGKNRVRAVEAGAMVVLVELLMDEAEIGGGSHKRRREATVVVVAALCGCAEGRAALVAHPAGIAAVARTVLRVSRLATEKAVKALLAVCRWGGWRVAEEMVEVGAATSLVMVVQGEPQGKARDMAKEIIGLHLARWSKSPCFLKTM